LSVAICCWWWLWLLLVAVPSQDYIKEDLDLFDFSLTDAEMATLDAISLPMPKNCNPNAP
jgi:diketogulonate reductase-like aldo/keto reductase